MVIIIPGSGPTDRNGNSQFTQNNSYKFLAEELAKTGIASLRFDKRGIGKSQTAGISEAELRFDHAIDDVTSWINFIKKNESSVSSIFVLGHSEGSLIGMLASQKADVAGFISIAGPGKPAAKLLKAQLATNPPIVQQEATKILDSLVEGNTVENIPTYLMQLFRPSLQPYLISWIKYDPAKEIASLKVPSLIVQGTTNIQVKTEDAKLLHQAATNSELKIIEGMNHVLKNSPEDIQQNIATYNQPDLPINEKLVEYISAFIK